MPRVAAAPQPEPELEPKPMDIHEMAAEQERAAEPKRAAEHDEQPEEEEEYKETITLRATDFYVYRTPWRTSNSRLWIYREMHARTGSRPRTCCGPF
jgi:hypothetical protein